MRRSKKGLWRRIGGDRLTLCCDIKLASLGIKLFSATKQDCKEELDLWTKERIYGSRSAQKPGQILRARYLKRPVSRANSFLP